MVNYIRHAVPKHAEYSSILSSLTSSKKPFKWSEKEEQAFQALKRQIMKSTILSYPDFSKIFEIYTDLATYQPIFYKQLKDKVLPYKHKKLLKL